MPRDSVDRYYNHLRPTHHFPYHHAHEAPSRNKGVVVMEVESVPLADGWSRRTDVGGYTGTAYHYRTAESTRQTGEGVLRFDIDVSEAGTYAVSIRARRDQDSGENVEDDKRNDVFVKMDSDQWWKATTHAAFGEWGWIDKKPIAHATFEPSSGNWEAATTPSSARDDPSW